MTNILLENSQTVTSDNCTLNTVAVPTPQPRRNRLVARWLTDENSKLYCQWVIED
jgi:hypothetical protein